MEGRADGRVEGNVDGISAAAAGRVTRNVGPCGVLLEHAVLPGGGAEEQRRSIVSPGDRSQWINQ